MPIVVVHNKIFESDRSLNEPDMLNLTTGTSNSISCSPYIAVPQEDTPGEFDQYKFLFWFSRGSFYTTPTLNLANVGSSDFEVTAWYVKTGGTEGTPHVRVSMFDINTGKFCVENPIGSVVPKEAWDNSSKAVYTNKGRVTIDAKDTLRSSERDITVTFKSWKIVHGDATTRLDDISVDENRSAIALATYRYLPVNDHTIEEQIPFEEFHKEQRAEIIFERIREKMGDWVKDPAPFDLARLMGEIKAESAKIKEIDQLTNVIMNSQKMSQKQLLEAQNQLKVESQRMEIANKLIKDAIGKKK